MTSDVVLSAALRTNLLSLQNTQSSIDITQNRLATGKKINSALDGPQAFFASQALTNRASDLTRLLDSIGQSIQVIKAADNGVTALTSLIEQADSIANSAQEALAQGQAEARVVGNVDLRGIDDLTTVSGITAADTLTLSLTDENGEAVEIGAYGTAGAASEPVAISAAMSTDQLIALINDIHINDGAAGANATGDQAFEASLNESGYLEVKSLNGGNFRVVFAGGAGAGDTDSEDLALANALGLSEFAKSAGSQTAAGNTSIEFTAIADVALRSFALYDSSATPDEIAQRSDLLSNIVDEDATALFTGLVAASDYTIAVNGQSRQTIDLHNGTTAVTIQDFIDDINGNSTLNTKIEATFDDATGVLSIKAIDASVTSIEIGVTGAAATANFGFGQTALATADVNAYRENIQLGAAAGELASLEGDYNRIRDQIDALVEDTGYRGTNLLNGNDLLTVFNEGRTSTLNTNGVTFTASGLGLEEADFSRDTAVDGALTQVREALTAVRNFGATLANDLTVIQTRETFTKALINTLNEGSDKLVNADQNEEGAKLLALQTRQSLGVTSLSLASQSQQSILRLF
ncbi:MAG: flagellin N-terminal helical domain-containing protein [Micavibrio sp.]